MRVGIAMAGSNAAFAGVILTVFLAAVRVPISVSNTAAVAELDSGFGLGHQPPGVRRWSCYGVVGDGVDGGSRISNWALPSIRAHISRTAQAQWALGRRLNPDPHCEGSSSERRTEASLYHWLDGSVVGRDRGGSIETGLSVEWSRSKLNATNQSRSRTE